MAISAISIRNCKSLKKIDVRLNNISCFVGENGTGKSNLMRTLMFFYNNIEGKTNLVDLFDKSNPYLDFIEISVTYDFTKIIRIALNQLKRDSVDFHPFFRKILYDIRPKLNEKNELTIKLKYFRNNEKIWNYEDQSILNLVKYLFPIIHIPARHIKLTDWEIIWDTIGEIANSKKLIKDQVSDEIVNMFDITYKERFSKDISYIKDEFTKNNIHLSPLSSNKLISHLMQLEFKGKTFKYNEEDLDYFSDGVNSNNYLKLLLSLVNRIQVTKLYEPTLIIDEPEIGLHPKLADELMEAYSEKSNNVNLIIATHSPRIVKNIIGMSQGTLFHVSLEGKYSRITKMKNFTDIREKNIVTENEASYYFSRGIIFVEGATELELFTNRKLISLFPILKQVDIFSFDSNNVKLNLVHPKENNTKIPYLVLLDLDKIIKFDNGKFSLTGDNKYNPFNNKDIFERERYYFGEKRYSTFQKRKRIIGILDKVIFSPDVEWKYIADSLFDDLKKLIKEYSLNYNVYPVETTTEGALVNTSNKEIFLEWFVSKSKKTKLLEKLLNKNTSVYYKITILRLLVKGKFDTLDKVNKDFLKQASSQVSKDINNLGAISFDKTDGWVNNFLNYYIEEYLEKVPDKIKEFKVHFPELYDIIKTVEKMMKKN